MRSVGFAEPLGPPTLMHFASTGAVAHTRSPSIPNDTFRPPAVGLFPAGPRPRFLVLPFAEENRYAVTIKFAGCSVVDVKAPQKLARYDARIFSVKSVSRVFPSVSLFNGRRDSLLAYSREQVRLESGENNDDVFSGKRHSISDTNGEGRIAWNS